MLKHAQEEKDISYTFLIRLAFTLLIVSVVGYLHCASRVITSLEVLLLSVHSILYCCFDLVIRS